MPGSVHHIVHHNDIIPHVPPRLFGFRQPIGEIWIDGKKGGPSEDDIVYECVGQEDKRCTDSVGFFSYVAKDHHGPYFGNIVMECVENPS